MKNFCAKYTPTKKQYMGSWKARNIRKMYAGLKMADPLRKRDNAVK